MPKSKRVDLTESQNNDDTVIIDDSVVDSADEDRVAVVSSGIEAIYVDSDADVKAFVAKFFVSNPNIDNERASEICLHRLLNGESAEGVVRDHAENRHGAAVVDNGNDNGETVADLTQDEAEVHDPIDNVLAVFPLACEKGIIKLLKQYDNDTIDVIQHMLERGYEKGENRYSNKNGSINADDIDFTSTSSFEPSPQYIKNAETHLRNDFPFLELKGLRAFLLSKKNHYTPVLLGLEDATGVKAQFYSLEKCTQGLDRVITAGASRAGRGKAASSSSSSSSASSSSGASSSTSVMARTTSITKMVLKPLTDERYLAVQTKLVGLTNLAVPLTVNKNTAKPFYHKVAEIDPLFRCEIEFNRKKRQAVIDEENKKITEQLRNELAALDGTAIECGCCCSDVAFENSVQCSDGHLFCKTCLQKYVEETIFGSGRTVIKCMNTMEVCTGFFTDEMLRISLSEKILRAYDNAVAKECLKSAQMEHLVACRKCQLQVEMPPEAGMILTCQRCNVDTCRYCGEDNHIPLRCDEVEKKSETDKRLLIEEAMTNARIRTCKKCKARFFKVEGCNKMTCACGAYMCYVCREDIQKEQYQHFCQTPMCTHKTCGKCKLYTDSVEDDRLAMRDAGLKAMEDAKASGADLKNIAVDKLLEEGQKKLPPAPIAAFGARAFNAMPAALAGGFGVFGGAMQAVGFPNFGMPPPPPVAVPLVPPPAPRRGRKRQRV